MRIVIIEDEETARRGLKAILLELVPEAIYLAELISVHDSIEWFTSNPAPDIVFMDIQLKDGLSFEILKEVEIKSPIVFCTAYDQYAIEAFKTHSIAYLLKPLNAASVRDCLDKISSFRKYFTDESLSALLDLTRGNIAGENVRSRFLIKIGKRLYHLRVDHIAYVTTNNKSTYAFDFKGNKYPMDFSLEQLEGELPQKDFFRINRQYIINIDSIVEAIEDYGDYQLKLNPPLKDIIYVSRYRFKDFKQWMSK